MRQNITIGDCRSPRFCRVLLQSAAELKRNLCKICSAFVLFLFFFHIQTIESIIYKIFCEDAPGIYPIGEEVWSDTYRVLCE